jgi:hypothetical protein
MKNNSEKLSSTDDSTNLQMLAHTFAGGILQSGKEYVLRSSGLLNLPSLYVNLLRNCSRSARLLLGAQRQSAVY